MDIKRRVFDTVRNKRMVKEWYRLHVKSGGYKYPFNMVMPDDAEQTAQIFDILLGDNLNGRKEYIVNHGAEYLDNIDVS